MVKLKKQISLNYLLVALTTIIFAMFALLFLYATFYVWFLSLRVPDYESSLEYASYIDTLNYLATIPAVSIILLLVLCLEKRTEKHALTGSYIALSLLAASAALFLSGGRAAVGVAAGSAILYQLYLLLQLFLNDEIISEKMHRVERAGSLIMHTGFSALVLSWVTLNSTLYELTVFWLATAMIAAGSLLTFFGRDINLLLNRLIKLYSQLS